MADEEWLEPDWVDVLSGWAAGLSVGEAVADFGRVSKTPRRIKWARRHRLTKEEEEEAKVRAAKRKK